MLKMVPETLNIKKEWLRKIENKLVNDLPCFERRTEIRKYLATRLNAVL